MGNNGAGRPPGGPGSGRFASEDALCTFPVGRGGIGAGRCAVNPPPIPGRGTGDGPFDLKWNYFFLDILKV